MRVSVRPEDGPGDREGVFGLLADLVKNANFAILVILVILGQFGVWGSFGLGVRFWSKSDILGSGSLGVVRSDLGSEAGDRLGAAEWWPDRSWFEVRFGQN